MCGRPTAPVGALNRAYTPHTSASFLQSRAPPQRHFSGEVQHRRRDSRCSMVSFRQAAAATAVPSAGAVMPHKCVSSARLA